MLDATVVNVALPHIGDDLDASVSSLQWVLTGYLLALASLILLGGALGDRYGRRKVFVIGTVWFAVASLLCGAAPNIEVLVGARVLQGVGAALLTPGQPGHPRGESSSRPIGPRPWARGPGSAASRAPRALRRRLARRRPGLALGLPDQPARRRAGRGCALYAVPETRDPHATRALDLLGAGLAVISLGAATWALTEAGPRGWTDPAVVGAGIVALVGSPRSCVACCAQRSARPALAVPQPDFTVTNVATVLLYSALGVTFFLVAYELQVGAGWSALAAGMALLPVTLLMLLFSARSGACAAHRARPSSPPDR